MATKDDGIAHLASIKLGCRVDGHAPPHTYALLIATTAERCCHDGHTFGQNRVPLDAHEGAGIRFTETGVELAPR